MANHCRSLEDSPVRIGYARVSTVDQNLIVQLEALKEATCDRLYREKISTRKQDRPELARMLDQIRQGDTLIVTKLDRLARSTRELLDILERIQEAGAAFISLGEPWADTTSHTGKLIMTVFAGIAEFERERTKELCQKGIKAARKRGVRFGRPPALTPNQVKIALRENRGGSSTGQIARTFGVSAETIRRLLHAQANRRANGSKGR
jgi:DNA invertase Pin-like site-specific DNA recombinase